MIVQSGARLKNVSKNVIFDLQKSNFLLACGRFRTPPSAGLLAGPDRKGRRAKVTKGQRRTVSTHH